MLMRFRENDSIRKSRVFLLLRGTQEDTDQLEIIRQYVR